MAVPVSHLEPPAEYIEVSNTIDPNSLELAELPAPKRRGLPPRHAPSSIDPLTTSPESQVEMPPVLLTVATRFDSTDFNTDLANGVGPHIPPDSSAAAGLAHVVNVTNSSIRIHRKDGSLELDTSLAAFFSALSPVNPTFDPKVIYDQFADRFVVLTLERQDDCPLTGDPTESSRILLAVSDDSDPNGTWFTAAIPANLMIGGVPHWVDFPGLAIDEEAVYITGHMFTFGDASCNTSFGATRLWILDKLGGAGGGLYSGGTASLSLFDPYGASTSCRTSAPFCGISQPAHVLGSAPDGPQTGTWLSLFNGLFSGANEVLQIMRIDNPVGPGVTTFVGPSFVSMGNIDDLGPVSLPDAPQKGDATTPLPPLIDTGDRRTLHSVWRDDRLYVTTTIDPESGDPNDGEATAHWVILDTSSLAGANPSITLVDQGDIGGEDIATGTHTFYPVVAVNDSNDLVIGFSASGASIFPSSYFATREIGDPPGTTSGSTILRAGSDWYFRTFGGTANRWGDYSGAAVDPFDQCFWIYNQHAISRGSLIDGEDGRWGTAYANACVSCPTMAILQALDISGIEFREARDLLSASSVTVEATGDLTLKAGTVALESGFRVLTGGRLSIISETCP